MHFKQPTQLTGAGGDSLTADKTARITGKCPWDCGFSFSLFFSFGVESLCHQNVVFHLHFWVISVLSQWLGEKEGANFTRAVGSTPRTRSPAPLCAESGDVGSARQGTGNFGRRPSVPRPARAPLEVAREPGPGRREADAVSRWPRQRLWIGCPWLLAATG